MAGKRANRDRIVGVLADRQHGVVSRAQLLERGLTPSVIDFALASGRLRPLFRGVYAVGHLALPREGPWMASLLASGDAAVLSHVTAAALWGLAGVGGPPVHVIAPSGGGRRRKGIVAHRMALDPSEWIVRDGLRVTTPARTIVDCAGALAGRPLRELVERSQDLHRFDAKRVAAILERNRGRPGRRQLCDLLELLGPDADGARSHLERLFLRLVRRAGLPRPQVNHVLAGRRRDFVWPRARLVVEVDGHRWHSSRSAKRRDHGRDRELTALGWRPVRFTYEDVAFEPTGVAAEVTRLI